MTPPLRIGGKAMNDSKERALFSVKLKDVLIPPYQRRWFPFYLFTLPRSANDYRRSCLRLSNLYLMFAGLTVLFFGGSSLLVYVALARHHERFELVTSAAGIVFLLSFGAQIWIKRNPEMGPVGLALLAIASFAGLPIGIRDAADFITSGYFFVGIVVVLQILFWLLIFGRFFWKGYTLLNASTDKELA